MIDCYIIGMIVISILLFATGLGLMIRGIRRYNFNILTLLIPFLGVLFSFPVYYALKESYLKKRSAPAVEVEREHRLTVLGLVFVAVFWIAILVMGVWSFTGAFDVSAAGGDMTPVLKAVWPMRLFWSMVAVCVAYVVAFAIVGRCKKK